MADDETYRTVIERANRMLKQSRTLRKLADELQEESSDLRAAAKKMVRKKSRRRRTAR